jgi:hypothetical protein
MRIATSHMTLGRHRLRLADTEIDAADALLGRHSRKKSEM